VRSEEIEYNAAFVIQGVLDRTPGNRFPPLETRNSVQEQLGRKDGDLSDDKPLNGRNNCAQETSFRT